MNSIITGSVDLSGISPRLFEPAFELRAAVVCEAAVLGSAVFTTGGCKEPACFSVAFAPPSRSGARTPCRVRLVIGPNLDDRALLSIDAISLDVDPAGCAVGKLQVELERGRCWILCRRLYAGRSMGQAARRMAGCGQDNANVSGGVNPGVRSGGPDPMF